MMAHERCGEEDAEAILSNLKMEGRNLDESIPSTAVFGWVWGVFWRRVREVNGVVNYATVVSPNMFTSSAYAYVLSKATLWRLGHEMLPGTPGKRCFPGQNLKWRVDV